MSYATNDELIAYALARGIVITDAEASILLVKADDWLDVQPITFETGVDLPDAIKTAEMVAALLINDGVNLFESGSNRIVSESIDGALSTTYANVETFYKQLEALIAPYRTGSVGGNSFDLQRG